VSEQKIEELELRPFEYHNDPVDNLTEDKKGMSDYGYTSWYDGDDECTVTDERHGMMRQGRRAWYSVYSISQSVHRQTTTTEKRKARRYCSSNSLLHFDLWSMCVAIVAYLIS
jgi:hypothetical protein